MECIFPRSSRAGATVVALTLVELMAVIAIIGVLSALLFLGISRMRAAARKSTAVSNVHQELSCWMLYQTDHGGRLMPASVSGNLSGYWLYWMQNYAPGAVQAAPVNRNWGFTLSPVKGPPDVAFGNPPYLAININMGPNDSIPGSNTFVFSRLVNPSKSVIFADSIWDVFAENYYGENSFTYRYDNGTTSLFGLADGHVETVKTFGSTPATSPARTITIPKGYYYSIGQTAPY